METALHREETTAPPRPPLTVFLWVLTGYFCVDAVMRGVYVVEMLTSGEPYSRTLLLRCVFQVLFGVLELLIVLQIFVRTIAARIFGTGLLFMHLLYSTYAIAFRNPDEWLVLEPSARLSYVGHLVFLAVAVVLLNRRPCRDVLKH